jgi:hypothetical protein
MEPMEVGCRAWSGFTWLRIKIVGGLLWMRWWTFVFCRHGVRFKSVYLQAIRVSDIEFIHKWNGAIHKNISVLCSENGYEHLYILLLPFPMRFLGNLTTYLHSTYHVSHNT